MTFSDRMGLTAPDTTLQVESMSSSLRNSLWNVLDHLFWSAPGFLYNHSGSLGRIGDFSRSLWADYFKRTVDSRSGTPYEILREIREYFFGCDWYEVYNFLEFVVKARGDLVFINYLNSILERELAGYRVINKHFVPVTDKNEIAEIEQALADIGPYAGARIHILTALEHLSRRENPDYRNSIKESISAVESVVREMTGNENAKLGDALANLERSGQIHEALKRGFSALYGYTSDEGGIRHAMLDEPKISATDAKYFLVSCSAFVNYLKSKVENH